MWKQNCGAKGVKSRCFISKCVGTASFNSSKAINNNETMDEITQKYLHLRFQRFSAQRNKERIGRANLVLSF